MRERKRERERDTKIKTDRYKQIEKDGDKATGKSYFSNFCP